MKKLIIEIETENAAFEDFPTMELARILHVVADRVECSVPERLNGCPIRDINGDKVGEIRIDKEQPKQNKVFFPILRIARGDIAYCLDKYKDKANEISNEDMEAIAERMSSKYPMDDYWYILQEITLQILDKD